MHFKQAGYRAALIDLGLIKEAAMPGAKVVAKGIDKVKGFFSRAPKQAPVPMQGQSFGPNIAGMADDSAANAFRSEMNAASATSKSPLLQTEDTMARFGTSPQATLHNIQGLKNTSNLPVTAPSPAGVAPSSGFTPAAAAGNRPAAAAAATPSGTGIPTPSTAGTQSDAAAAATGEVAKSKPGLLTRIRNNPIKSVALAGAGLGTTGYVMGMGSPPPGQPMQEYGNPQQQMMPMGYR
jgi:hypothetical protein